VLICRLHAWHPQGRRSFSLTWCARREPPYLAASRPLTRQHAAGRLPVYRVLYESVPRVPMALHQLATIVWVGGMFFAHFALRPTIKQTLEPPARIQWRSASFGASFPGSGCPSRPCGQLVCGSLLRLPKERGLHVHIMMVSHS